MVRPLSICLAAAMIVYTAETVPTVAAQSITTEADITAATSTQDVKAAATQMRAFGDLRGWRFYGDGSWAITQGQKSDAFGASYPYEPKFHPMELKIERIIIKDQRLLGVRAGRYRTPFGMYSGSDQGYIGFLRAPLMRNSYYWALSNNYLETGASVTAGTTWLSTEVSTSVASDEDAFARPGGVNNVVRVQGAGGGWIAGVSYIRTRPSRTRPFAKGRAEFAGVDLRWMKNGVQLRGEVIEGRPFQGVRTRAGYADVLVHRPAMGPVTAVARIERLDYFAGPFSEFPRRYTAGAKIRLTQGLTAQVNYIHQPFAGIADLGHRSLDVELTYSIRPETLLGRKGL